ncbi:hypothetical protein CCUS01_03572 [Colletotrichum cuscutae]|uniref:SnoaL-like domain-containing protein n=1 Tax=Colletotrichum cuscutae TaxID=1209917 RepID=A0AAI9VF66_9PEZI|nr:hypothetical protein CCUS01_03572 [Colletotrichum cuscutae]
MFGAGDSSLAVFDSAAGTRGVLDSPDQRFPCLVEESAGPKSGLRISDQRKHCVKIMGPSGLRELKKSHSSAKNVISLAGRVEANEKDELNSKSDRTHSKSVVVDSFCMALNADFSWSKTGGGDAMWIDGDKLKEPGLSKAPIIINIRLPEEKSILTSTTLYQQALMASQMSTADLVNHLKAIYASYRHTEDIDAKGIFFSPSCYQICRPNPSFAAHNRETIVRYLHEYAPQDENGASGSSGKPAKKGYYTIRPLEKEEFEFGADEQTAPAGFSSASEVEQKARREGWVGLRVDLWDESPGHGTDRREDLLVKVQYWWRREEGNWMQIFHDIMYMGPRDGSEGVDAEVLE